MRSPNHATQIKDNSLNYYFLKWKATIMFLLQADEVEEREQIFSNILLLSTKKTEEALNSDH